MHIGIKSSLAVALAALVAAEPAAAAERCTRELAARIYPAAEWAAGDPAAHGWSAADLEAAWARVRQSFSAAMLVHRGRVIGTVGDVTRPMETRSMRKSFLNIVAGRLVADGRLRLDSTLASLGIDDVTPLTDQERSATVRDLMASRSGIYLPAAFVVPGDEDAAPARGSHRPGEAFFYWNWGFNALGTIVERAGGDSLFALFERAVARPLGLQDFVRSRDTRYVAEPVSRHPAYLFDLSTRDRARIGLLYLNRGCWRGRRIVDPDWVRDSIAPVTDREQDFDYGYLWWSTEPPAGSGLTERLFMARGFANQYLIGIPELDAVLVISVDMARGREAGLRPPRRSDFEAVFDLILRARPGAPHADSAAAGSL